MIESELPDGWIWTELNNFSEIVLGQSPPSSTYNEEHMGLPFYQGKSEFGSIYPTPRKWCSVPKKIAEKGDVLISVRAPVGPTNVCPERSCIVRGLAAIRGKGGIEPFFILYLIRSVEQAISNAGTGSTFDAINGNQLKLLRLPLPPLSEQYRIASKIEELFSYLDAGVEGLHKVKAQLKRYRQAVLKAAVEGRLTEEWRKAHPEVEPAEKLLERIKRDIPRTNKEITKFKSILSGLLDEEAEAGLPNGWAWATVEQLASRVTSGSRGWAQFYSDSGPLFIRAHDLKTDKLCFDQSAFVQIPYSAEGTRTRIQFGDILIVITGANVTKSALVESDLGEAYVSQHVGMLRPATIDLAHYLYIYIIAPKYGRDILKKQAYGAGKPGLNLDNIRNLIIRLPPLAEQAIIVEEVERCKSIADNIEAIIEESFKRADRLRQSILKHAFEGRLVPQVPDDEPASMLLGRIIAKKAGQAKRTKRQQE
jgi:type I restriction enzyme, S subunit